MSSSLGKTKRRPDCLSPTHVITFPGPCRGGGKIKRYQAVDEFEYQFAALGLAEQISTADQWFEKATPVEAYEVVDGTLAAMVTLRQVVNRRALV